MLLLILFAFIAGVVTILSPCILPILPIVLSGTVGGKSRPYGVVLGFIGSFTFFTLFLSSLVKLTGISSDSLRVLSVITIFLFGLSLLLPQFQLFVEKLFARFSNLAPKSSGNGFFGGVLVGLSLGLVWTPCVGPILASVISLALSGSVNGTAVIITLAYAMGTAIPLFIMLQGGRAVFQKHPGLLRNSAKIQKVFGVFMILTAIAIQFNLDRRFQTYVLEVFPQYGAGLTSFENNDQVKTELSKLGGNTKDIKQSVAPELIQGGEWFNSEPLKISELEGKVVLVDFWTYTCINCIRTLPYLKSWHEKYSDKGLIIVGVHAPEFEFEKSASNVKKAISDFGITYPVMQDNNFATWRAYSNRYWPAKYLIDKSGQVVYTHFGEGDYDETEAKIQELLSISAPISNLKYSITSLTPEIYLGSARTDKSFYSTTGVWNTTLEHALPTKGSKLTVNFEAKDVFLVMRPKSVPGEIKIFLDGKFQKQLTVDSDQLYDILKLSEPGKHVLDIEFLDNNLELFAFTFG